MTSPQHYLADPLSRLRNTPQDDGTDNGGPVAATAALLAHVANRASADTGTPITALTIITPDAWGPRSRQRLNHAATSAGLPEPTIVTAAAAAAVLAASDDAPPTSRYVLVCASGDNFPTITVLDAGDQYTQLSTAIAHDPDAPGIHHALAELIRQRTEATTATPAEPDWATALEIDRARTALVNQPRTPVLLPTQHAPAVLDRADLAKTAQPHLDQLQPAVAQALADADVRLDDITATVLVAFDATATGLEVALTDAGLPPVVTVRQPDALAAGALQLTSTHESRSDAEPTAATIRLPRTRLTVSSLTATAVLAVCSVALLFQAIATADITTIATTVVGVRLPTENVALAAALAATTAGAAAQLAPTTWLSPKGLADQTSTGILLRRSYLAAAAVGLALAGLWGLGVGVGVEYTSDPYVRRAVTAAAPIALCATVIALVSPRLPGSRLAGWLTSLRPPVWAIAAAAAGVYLMRSAFTLTFPANVTGYPGIVAAVGAAVLGAATAATATRQLLIRVTVGTVLLLGYAFVATVSTVAYLTIAYIAVLIWWNASAAARTVYDAMSGSRNGLRGWLQRA